MGFLHLIQDVLMILLSNDTAYPVYSNFFKFDMAARALVPNPQIAFELRFGPAVAVFLLLSAVAHFFLATVGYKLNVSNLKKGMNPVRFYEYALSSSIMIVLIGLLVGLYGLGAIIRIFGLYAMMNMFGIMMEYHNQYTQKTNWLSFVYGSVAGIIPWVVIVHYFVGSIAGEGGEPPAFVYAITPTLFFFFTSFAINMILQYKKVGKWKNYLFGEKTYME